MTRDERTTEEIPAAEQAVMDARHKPQPFTAPARVGAAAGEAVAICHGIARNAGWWTDLDTGEEKDRPLPELLMLVVTELAEAMEGYRKGMGSDKIPGFSAVEEELADVLIRVCDIAGGKGLRLAEAVEAKLRYNLEREDHRPENRRKQGGKRV